MKVIAFDNNLSTQRELLTASQDFTADYKPELGTMPVEITPKPVPKTTTSQTEFVLSSDSGSVSVPITPKPVPETKPLGTEPVVELGGIKPIGGSLIVEPDLGLPTKDNPTPIFGGGGGGGVVSDVVEEVTETIEPLQEKKKFPLLLVGVALLVGYLVFKKK